MRVLRERADVSSTTDVRQDGNGDVSVGEIDANRDVNVVNAGTKADMSGWIQSQQMSNTQRSGKT